MRQIVLDTETTGLEPERGHRIIEIGCVEMVDRRLTENDFHCYINPQRSIDDAAVEVHGITLESLKDKPVFADICDDFLNYVEGAELIIHNAAFDVGFLNHELTMAKGRKFVLTDCCTVIDSLSLARKMHPGQKNNLDALCRRYGIDNSGRQMHGALLDASLLAEVYLTMTGGQEELLLDADDQNALTETSFKRNKNQNFRIVAPTAEEQEAHSLFLEHLDKKVKGRCLWSLMERGDTL